MKHSSVWERSRLKGDGLDVDSMNNKGVRIGIPEAARKMGCSKASVYRLIDEGKLPAISLFDSGRGLRVYEADVESYIKMRESAEVAI